MKHCSGNPGKTLGNLDINRRIILNWILNILDEKMVTTLQWLQINPSGDDGF
jgi:hypothetical protein